MRSGGDFWTKRRAAVEAEALSETRAIEDLEAQEQEHALAERSDEDILQELNLPEPEHLDSPESVQDFLKSAVPQRLKTRALRRLWRLNPVLANLDGLIEYGEDYTDAATVIENLQTTYQVGKGMMAHLEALASNEESDQESDEADGETAETAEEPVIAVVEVSEIAAPEPETPDPQVADASEHVPETYVSHAPRRMRFSFDTAS